MFDTAGEVPSPPRSTLPSVQVSDEPPPADTCQVGIFLHDQHTIAIWSLSSSNISDVRWCHVIVCVSCVCNSYSRSSLCL